MCDVACQVQGSHMQKDTKVEGRVAPFCGFSARARRYSDRTPERLPVPYLRPMMTASISTSYM